jgi:ribosomal protein L24E
MIYNFYVYAYVREDGTPYYIGKGSGKRAWAVHQNARKPIDKSRIIICENNLSEIGSFALERRLIKWHGLKTQGGILHNFTYGGPGCEGHAYKRSEKTLVKLRNSKKDLKWYYNINNLEEVSRNRKPRGVEWILGRSPKTKHGGSVGVYDKNRCDKAVETRKENGNYVAWNKDINHSDITKEKIRIKALSRPVFTCEFCQKQIKGKGNLSQHIKAKHELGIK